VILDRLQQGILPRPTLAEHAARKLRADPALADLLTRVAGDLDRAGSLLRPAVVRRLVRV
jgi:hypothetical protein